MELISGEEASGFVDGIVYKEKQIRELTVDLTVKEVHSVKCSGALDFGGSEYREAETERLEPAKKECEEYGWWKLDEGVYLIRFNETVKPIEGLGLLSPHPRLLKAGAAHPTLFLHEWESGYVLPLQVGWQGLELKENSRVSKLIVLK